MFPMMSFDITKSDSDNKVSVAKLMHILLPPSWRYEPSERKQREERREEKKKQTIVNTEQGFNKDLAAQADDGSISLDLIQLFLHLAMEYLGAPVRSP
ncbi:hypothetical protein JOB18_005236 [Solea senegalensis]|uniref:Uncharacterized protein n=1 Tax=Solea senegalensis TaxID=28829 RepID=A0AAV6S1P8_SOLSE|nr:hypothetical protein JOB18_005236 [Solea senegalensis]